MRITRAGEERIATTLTWGPAGVATTLDIDVAEMFDATSPPSPRG